MAAPLCTRVDQERMEETEGSDMDYMTFYEKPAVKTKYIVLAFAGWPDAGEAATGVVKYLLSKLPSKKCAEIDPEEFYDFIHVRPRTELTPEGQRRIVWPANEMFCWANEDASEGMLLFVGIEPSLRWRAFANTLMGVAEENDVHTAIYLGSLLDAVPHTRDVQVSGSATAPKINNTLRETGVHSSNYQGPTGISSAVLEACKKRGIEYVSLWGHAPHYLQATPNYKVSYALLSQLNRLLELPIDLEELRSKAQAFEAEVNLAVGKDPQVGAYVRKLEERYDEMVQKNMPMPQPEEVVRELEQFLKERQQENGGPGEGR